MKTSEILFFIAFGVVTTFIITMTLRDKFRKRQIRLTLTSRNQNDDDRFRKLFSDPKRADVAIRVRRVLSKNLELPLDGLMPSDRLNDDLNAELPANPHLFWELEMEFAINTGIDDLDTFEKTLERVVTFQDLVEFVEERTSQPQTEPTEDEDSKSSRTYDFAIRSLPFLFIGGVVTAVVGILIQNRSLMNLGGLIFMSGAAVWGLANGGEMLRNIFKSSRSSSGKEVAARTWPRILFTCLALFFVWFGGMLVWGILKNLLSSK